MRCRAIEGQHGGPIDLARIEMQQKRFEWLRRHLQAERSAYGPVEQRIPVMQLLHLHWMHMEIDARHDAESAMVARLDILVRTSSSRGNRDLMRET